MTVLYIIITIVLALVVLLAALGLRDLMRYRRIRKM